MFNHYLFHRKLISLFLGGDENYKCKIATSDFNDKITGIYWQTMQVDVKNFRKPTILLQWMGMNALAVYALAACELLPAALQGFYWRTPENNLVSYLP